MRMIFQLIAILLVTFCSANAAAQRWGCQCLRDCFATGHDCNFCAYQCEANDSNCPLPQYDELECPLCDSVNDP